MRLTVLTRPLALLALCGFICSGAGLSLAQTTGEATEPVEQQVEETSEEEQKAAAEQAELDSLIIGPWVRIASDATANPNGDDIAKSVERCVRIAPLNGLKIETAADKKLPKRTQLRGDLIYYRTENYLQRLDSINATLIRLPNVQKTEQTNGSEIWLLSGNRARMRVRFADTKQRGGRGEFMVDDTGVYLRCPLPRAGN